MKSRLLLNALGFQLCWLAWVGGAAKGTLLPGLALTSLYAAWQLLVSPHRQADLVLIALCLLCGLVVDGALSALGLIEYRLAGPLPAPLWILGLWASFALTLNHSLAFLGTRPLLAAGLGGLGAPLAYFAAAHGWQAASLGPHPLVSLSALALVWALLTPLLCELAARSRRSPLFAIGALR